MNTAKERVASRKVRALRVRKKVVGSSQRPRLSVRRTLKHIIAQVTDDQTGKSLVQVSSSSKEFCQQVASVGKKLTKCEVAKLVGECVAAKAKDQSITKVVFDRKGYLYHGRVRSVAEGARSKGLVF